MKKLVYLFLFLFAFNFGYSQETLSVFDIARKGTVEQAKEKLKENPKAFFVVNDEGYSPLTLACYRGNNEVAKLLIDTGSDINGKSKMGTPLMACIVKGNNEIAKLLIEMKADLNVADGNGTTALIYAANFKNYGLTAALVQAGANVNFKDIRNNSALDYALLADDDKLIEILKTKKL